MAVDEALAERVRAVLAGTPEVVERRMFGGLAFMIAGRMACGVRGEDLIARLGPDGGAAALDEPGVRPMSFRHGPTAAFLLVSPEAVRKPADLERWIRRALAFVATLPPREPRAGRGSRPRPRL